MPITVYTETQWQELARGYLRSTYAGQNGQPGKRVDPQSFLGQEAQAWGQFAALLSKAILDADKDGIPAYQAVNGVLQSRNSTQALDNWAYTFGLPSNRGPGAFGRNGPQVATGGVGTVYGTPGTSVPTGTLLTDGSGSIVLSVVTGFTIGGGGSYAAGFQAVNPGAAGNLGANSVIAFSSPPAGISPTTVTLNPLPSPHQAFALMGGYDSESDLDLLGRLIRHLQTPPKGGTAADYRTWAEESTNLTTGASLGVNRAYVYPRRSGLGTEDICITTGGSGVTRAPTGAVLALCQSYIDSVRPANDSPTVVLPFFDSAQKLTIEVLAKPGPLYTWDWNNSSVTLGTSTSPTQLVLPTANLTGSLPTLAAAIDNGRNPRIQISLPAYQAVPYVVTALSRADVAGTTTITLAHNADGSNPLPVTPPTSTRIYPAGGAVLPVALAVLGYIDSVGPSQQSGWQDVITDAWEAKVTIGRIAQAALDATDPLGNKVLVYIPGVGDGLGVTIAVGAGGATSDDFPLFDNVPNQGPQLPEAAVILVLPG
jgi:hypothetical protein